jgi:phosphoribosylamine-glycine ligase
MVEACIRIAIGEKPDIEPKWNKGSAIRYFKQVAGVVNRIEGIKEAEHTEGIQCVTIVHGVGNEITEIIDSGSRMGFVIAQSDSVKEAIRVCENALEKLDIKVNENELNALNGVSV